MTVLAFSICLAAIKVRHGLSKVCIADILKLIAIFCIAPHNCPTTYHTFAKNFDHQQAQFTKYHYCENCQAPLNNTDNDVDNDESIETDEVNNMDTYCDCTDRVDEIYFLEIPVIPQLENLYQRQGFYDSITNNSSRSNNHHFRDIYDGEIYRQLSQPNEILSNKNNISFQWYTDGVKIFNSSKYCIWGFFLIILELPYTMRYRVQNVLLIALWFGDEKPNPNLFLMPLKQSIKKVYEGIKVYVRDLVKYITIRGIICCGTADLPAKALFLCMNQCNGRFGCNTYLEPGKTVQKTRVYPYKKEVRIRTDSDTLKNAKLAVESNIPVCGVKGPSILCKISKNYVTSTGIDIMHCGFEGIVKRLGQLWFDSKFIGEKFSFHNYVEVCDYRLCSIQPPCSVARRPRPIKTHFSYWKAHELKNWGLYYLLPTLHGILPDEYLSHYMYLWLGFHLLCKETVTEEMIILADKCFDKFIEKFPDLYGEKFMTCNLHLLKHLPLMVRRFGPLFTTSCYPLEDLNGKLKSMVRSSNEPHLQIVSNLGIHMAVYTHKNDWLKGNEEAIKFCDKVLSPTRKLNLTKVGNNVFLLGSFLKRKPDYLETIAVEKDWAGKNVSIFSNAYKNSILYTSEENQKGKKTDSSYVKYRMNNSLQFGIIQNFVRITICKCKKICDCDGEHYAIVEKVEVESPFSVDLSPDR